MAAVLVAAETVALIGVELVHDLFHIFLGLGGLANVVIHINSVVAGLVTMGVLANEAGDVHLFATREFTGGGEESVEFLAVGFGTAHQVDMCVDILRHEEVILPGIGFGEGEVDLGGIERLHEAPVAAALEELVGRVIEVLISLCSKVEFVGDFRLAEGLRQPAHAPVVVGIFQCFRSSFAFLVDRDESILHVGTHATAVLTR